MNFGRRFARIYLRFTHTTMTDSARADASTLLRVSMTRFKVQWLYDDHYQDRACDMPPIDRGPGQIARVGEILKRTDGADLVRRAGYYGFKIVSYPFAPRTVMQPDTQAVGRLGFQSQ